MGFIVVESDYRNRQVVSYLEERLTAHTNEHNREIAYSFFRSFSRHWQAMRKKFLLLC